MKFKKIVSVLICIVLLLSSVSTAFAETSTIKGDVDGNGVIEITDATLVQKCVAEILNLSEEELTAADMDESGNVDINDVTKIQLIAAGLIDPEEKFVFHDEYINSVLNLMNEERAAAGVAPISLDDGLNAIAKIRAEEITEVFDHTRPNGEPFYQIGLETIKNIQIYTLGENIAMGYYTPQAVMTGWMNSQGHRENILNKEFNYVGISCVEYNDILYWVQYFVGGQKY